MFQWAPVCIAQRPGGRIAISLITMKGNPGMTRTLPIARPARYRAFIRVYFTSG
ncbi:MAG: hypothetical protein JRH06_00620 [Deltaproteobacteria bacterium]|nr:hypothetical protein [Deltaproteobacteria bacterium]MBW2136044.1 hypothetical protein [Deltaproteobacteria bacterium]